MSDPTWAAASGQSYPIGAAVLAVGPSLENPAAPEVVEPAASVAQQQKALCQKLQKRLKYFGSQHSDDVTRWKRNRRYVNGEEGEDGQAGLVRVNLIASVVNTIQPNIYAKAPEVSVQPEERITPSDYQGLRGFARTLELVLNRYAIRGGQLKARGKEAVRSSLTCTTGWVKVIYQQDKREDPLIRNRINDAQDNVLRIEQLLRETKDEGASVDYEAKMAELRQQISALEQQVEVTVSEGVVIDNVAAEHIRILDASVKSIDEYAQASAIAHGVYMTVAAYKAQFGGKEPPKKATRYSAGVDEDDGEPRESGRATMDEDDQLVLVWEIWSKDDLTVYTICQGAEEFCREPYQPATLGQVWYPFFPLQLWRVNGYLYARALVDNLIELVDEYNTRRTSAAEHRKKNTAVRLFNKAAGVTDAELDAINRRTDATEMIGVTVNTGEPLQNSLGSLPEIPYNPAMYDTGDILRDVEMVSGAQDASRGGVNQAKTATEAEIMAMGMQSRTSEQLDTIEDWLTSILTYAAQLLLLNLTPEQVRQRFGEGAVWPTLNKQDLFEQVMVQIRAGSTAKPNKMRERDQWLQFLPQLQQAIVQISDLQKAGNEDMADALIKVLDETLRRFDERMSIREFIPGLAEEGEEDGRGAAQKMMQQGQAKLQQMMQQAQAMLEERQKALDEAEREHERRATELQVKEIQFGANQEVEGMRRAFDAKAKKLEAKELADSVVSKVTSLLDRHQQDMSARGLPVAPVVVDEVHAELAPVLARIDPPAVDPAM